MTVAPQQSPHNAQLQSLRGIAAVVVMIHHCLRTFQPDGWAWQLSEAPLNGGGAVIIFFVLSGYVLSASLVRRGLDRDGVTTFFVRRVFRIYPALWVGLLAGVVYMTVFRPLAAPHLAGWVLGHFLPGRFGPVSVIGSIAGLDNYLLPTAWSITVELCASALLPVLVWVFLRHRALALPIILLLAVLCALAGPALRQVPYYLVDFALGAALACVPFAQRLRPGVLAMLLAVAVIAFANLAPLPAAWWWIASLAMGLASMALVAGLIARQIAWLGHRWLVAVGDWSYSIYLLHLPIAFAAARAADHLGLVTGDRNTAALGVAVVTSALTVSLSALVYRFVELPGIAAGSAILDRWKQRRAPVT